MANASDDPSAEPEYLGSQNPGEEAPSPEETEYLGRQTGIITFEFEKRRPTPDGEEVHVIRLEINLIHLLALVLPVLL
jgi:hypothetical protein